MSIYFFSYFEVVRKVHFLVCLFQRVLSSFSNFGNRYFQTVCLTSNFASVRTKYKTKKITHRNIWENLFFLPLSYIAACCRFFYALCVFYVAFRLRLFTLVYVPFVLFVLRY